MAFLGAVISYTFDHTPEAIITDNFLEGHVWYWKHQSCCLFKIRLFLWKLRQEIISQPWTSVSLTQSIPYKTHKGEGSSDKRIAVEELLRTVDSIQNIDFELESEDTAVIIPCIEELS